MILDVRPNSPLKFLVHLRGLDWFPCGMKDGLQFCHVLSLVEAVDFFGVVGMVGH